MEYNIVNIMSDFLFAMPKTVDGIASVIVLFGVYNVYNNSVSELEADRRAFTADMQALQRDMKAALNAVNQECQKNTSK